MRIKKTIKIIEFHKRIKKNDANYSIPCEHYRIPFENHENHENQRMPCENQENNENLRIP